MTAKSRPGLGGRANAAKAASSAAEAEAPPKPGRRSRTSAVVSADAGKRPRSRSGDRPRGRSRELLLDAASHLLSQRNSIDVSLSEIAQESGLNSALISYHFGNKEGLLLALVRRDADTALRQLDQLLAMDIPPEQKIRLHIRGVISTYAKYPYLNRLIHMLLDDGKSEPAKEVASFFIDPLVAGQQKMIEEGIAAEVFRPVDAAHFYFTFIGACDILFYGRATREHTFGSGELTPATRERYADFVAETALRILRPE
jgi:AcrR family transcriptional regulator